MPVQHFGPCCSRPDGQRGIKRWGDGKGSSIFDPNEKTFYCHMCLYELEKPLWAHLAYESEAEFLKDAPNLF